LNQQPQIHHAMKYQQFTVVPMPDDPEDTRTEAQLKSKLSTDFWKEHAKTVRELCEKMHLTFVGSSDHQLLTRPKGYAKIPFFGRDNATGTESRFELLVKL